MKKRKFNPKSLENLKDDSAPDKPGETKPTTTRITLKQREWLDAQPEGRSYHVRQALQMYIDSLSQNNSK